MTSIKLKTEEYNYTYTAEDRARTAHWTDEQTFQWLEEMTRFIHEMRTLEERADALRRKGKYGVYTEHIIQCQIYKNPEAWRYLPDGEQATAKAMMEEDKIVN